MANPHLRRLTTSVFALILTDIAFPAVGQDLGCAPPSAGLVSWWPGDGDARDIGLTNSGTFLNGALFGPGMVGQGFRFDGNGNYVKAPASASLNVGVGSGFTVEAWINPANIQDGPIVEWIQPGIFQVHFYVGAGQVGGLYAAVFGTDGNPHSIQSASGLLESNTFQHVALTYDKATGVAALWLNGVAVYEATLGVFTPLTTGDLYIGYRPSTTPYGPRVFRGIIDEVTLYSRALSAAELQSIYNAGSTGKCCAPFVTTQPQGQVGYWGGNVTFAVRARGEPSPAYLWYKDSIPISWATQSTLVLTNLDFPDAGGYYAVVANSLGGTNSATALLVVNPAGVSLGLYPGLVIQGVVGKTYGIQYATNVAQTSLWTTLDTLTLTQQVQMWFDSSANVNSGGNPRRFYRVIAVP